MKRPCTLIALAIALLAGCSTPIDPVRLNPQISTVSFTMPQAGKSNTDGGRAFFITTDGLLVTSRHPSRAGDTLQISSGFGNKTATVLQTDDEADIALLRIEGTGYPAFKLESEDVEPGMSVRVIAGSGIIPSRLTHWEEFGQVIELRASLVAGDIGSPVVDHAGLVVGVIRSIDRDSRVLMVPVWRIARMLPPNTQAQPR